jgi:thioester reductase-like protein
MQHLLLTGGSGLLGSQLLARLLLQGRQVAVLVRPKASTSATERIESLLIEQEERLGTTLTRPVILEGELTLPLCGLSDTDVAWIRRSCTGVIHSAASLKFIGHDKTADPWRTNVAGTCTLLELAARAQLKEFHHISTAYVCGLSAGQVDEVPSTTGPGFRNDYEASKHEAEWLIRHAGFLDRPTFLRPAVIVGDSQTGATSTYHGLMAMLQLMTVIARNVPADDTGFRYLPMRLSMTGDEKRNLVPVDWVAEAIARLIDDPRARGRTIHLAPRRPITSREVIEFASSYLNPGGLGGFTFCGPAKPDDLNDIEEAAYAAKGLYEGYEQTDPTFMTTTIDTLLPDLPCPVIDEAMIHRFLSYGEADQWGRRRKVRRKAKNPDQT